MSGKFPDNHAFNFLLTIPDFADISESSQSLSQILKECCLQWYGYPVILSIPIPKKL